MSVSKPAESKLIFTGKKGIEFLILGFFILAAIGLRLVDFTDLPLDSSSEQQLRSMIVARGLYYEMQGEGAAQNHQAEIDMGKAVAGAEPPIFEGLTALTYLVIGRQNILAGRAWSIIFWVMGGIPLFLLARKWLPAEGAFTALAFYLFVPSGAFLSRNFMPDPMAVSCLLWALYFQTQWTQTSRLRDALLAGVFGGITLLLRPAFIFFIVLPCAGLLLHRVTKKGQTWVCAAISLLPAVFYYGVRLAGGSAFSTLPEISLLPRLALDVNWYLDWLQMIKKAAGYFPLIIGLLSFFLLTSRQNRLFYGELWLAYVIFGFISAYPIHTQDHSQLPLLPILALGMGIALTAIIDRLTEPEVKRRSRVLIPILFIASIGLCAQNIVEKLNSYDYRQQAAFWRQLGESIGTEAEVVAVTPDKGYELSYWGGVVAELWPTTPDLMDAKELGQSEPDFDQRFNELTAGKDLFVVTLTDELNLQPELRERLYADYPVQNGEGYLIFDLAHPLAEEKSNG